MTVSRWNAKTLELHIIPAYGASAEGSGLYCHGGGGKVGEGGGMESNACSGAMRLLRPEIEVPTCLKPQRCVSSSDL